ILAGLALDDVLLLLAHVLAGGAFPDDFDVAVLAAGLVGRGVDRLPEVVGSPLGDDRDGVLFLVLAGLAAGQGQGQAQEYRQRTETRSTHGQSLPQNRLGWITQDRGWRPPKASKSQGRLRISEAGIRARPGGASRGRARHGRAACRAGRRSGGSARSESQK